MSRVVVSGATGFLGGHLCARLKGDGHEVLAIGRDGARGAALGVTFAAIDLGDTAKCPWGRADIFIHAAALSSAWGSRAAFERANVTGTRNAIAMARNLGVSRFVFISSPSVGFRFRDQLGVRETAPLPTPVNDYAATKIIAEDLVRGSGLDAVTLRPRGIYGPGDTALLPRLIRAAARPLPLLRGGVAVTDLTYVGDIVEAICRAMTAGHGTYNISGAEPLAIRDIITRAAAAASVTTRFRPVPVTLALAGARAAEAISRLRPGQPEPVITAYGVGVLAYSQTLDIAAARRELGYAPQVDFAEGLRRTFAAKAPYS